MLLRAIALILLAGPVVAADLPLVRPFEAAEPHAPLVFDLTPDGGFIVAGHREGTEKGRPELRIARLGPAGQRLWERAFGRQTRAIAVARIRALPDGGFLLLNDFLEEDGDRAASLQRLDRDGRRTWSHRFQAVVPLDLALLPGGGFTVAGAGADAASGAVLQRFDPAGKFESERHYRGRVADRADAATHIETLGDGSALVGGVADYDARDPDAERRGDAWVARLDPAGGQIWRWFSGERNSSERVAAMDRQGDGRVVVAISGDARESGGRGNRLIGLAPDGTERWNKLLDDDKASLFVLDVAARRGGGAIAAGFSASQTSDSFTAVVLALDADGRQLWRRDFLDPAFERAIAVRRLEKGYAVLLDAGPAASGAILRLDEAGNPFEVK